MHGQLVVQSVYGKGSKFTVSIDQKIAPSTVKLEDTIEVSRDELAKDKDIVGKSVLVVDDNKLNIKVATRLLSDLPYEIDECYNGKECLEKLKSNSYDLILMDIMMPEMDGEATIKELRNSSDFKTPVIALTADAVAGANEKYMSEGFIDYLAKPFKKEDLENKIVKVLKIGNIKKSKIDWDSMPTVVIGGDINNIKNNEQ